ncbi:hypothetical protein XENTR_v10015881 [Xenopus tropicalis]|nr:hypothetical protein XENTR_v10015881 [Xenopus tropicalis]
MSMVFSHFPITFVSGNPVHPTKRDPHSLRSSGRMSSTVSYVIYSCTLTRIEKLQLACGSLLEGLTSSCPSLADGEISFSPVSIHDLSSAVSSFIQYIYI